MMRKLSKIVLLALLAAPLVPASAQKIIPIEDSGMKTICYYGVTLKVTNKIAERYMKLGATMGACGEKPSPCGPGQIFLDHGPFGPGCYSDFWMLGKATIEKPADSEKAIQLDLSNDEAAQGLLNLDARAVVSR